MNSTPPPDPAAKAPNAARFLDPAAPIIRHRSKLPHWQQTGGTFFVTWRLADAIPAVTLDEWHRDREHWTSKHPQPWTAEVETEYHRLFSMKFEEWMDAGMGDCLLRLPEAARIVEGALRHFDGDRYDLWAFVVMPNHVHVLFTLRGESKLPAVLKSWKGFTAREINKIVGRTGVMWQHDYFDRMIRNEAHFHRCRAYIRNNADKAGVSPSEVIVYEHAQAAVAAWVEDREDQRSDAERTEAKPSFATGGRQNVVTPQVGLHFLITAGPTREAIDPVRFLSNRSSGRMGFAIAEAAAAAGHRVTLIAGPVGIETPVGVERRDVVSAEDMFRAVEATAGDADVAILAAAVADYRPVAVASQKIKKPAHPVRLTLELEPTRDILGSMREPMGFRGVLAGFAAETENLIANARGKLERKGCDLVVANDVSRDGTGFDSIDNEVTLLFKDGTVTALPRASKLEIARELVTVCASLAAARQPAT